MGISNGPRENEIQRGIDRTCAGFPFIVKIKMYLCVILFFKNNGCLNRMNFPIEQERSKSVAKIIVENNRVFF